MREKSVYISILLVSSGALAQNYNYGGQGTNYGLGNNANSNSGGNTYGGNNYGGKNYGGGNQYSQGNNYGNANEYGGGNNYGGDNQYSQGNNYGNSNEYGSSNNYGSDSQYSEGNTYGNANEYGSGNNYSTPLIDNTTSGNAYGGSTNGSNPSILNPAGGNYIPANANATTQSQPAVTQALPPGPPVERDFQFESFGVAGIHIFKMKWPDSNRNVQTIEVYRTDTGDLLQNIIVPQEGLRLVYSELAEPTNRAANNIRDQILDTPDYNFDNLNDIRLTKEWPYAAGNKSYYIWLYDTETDQYKLSPELSALPAPIPNSKDKRIESVTLMGWGGAEYVKNIYSISAEGQLRIDTRITNTIFDSQKLWFVRDVRTRVNGELQRVCKFLMRSEGVHKRLWGQKSTCQPYLVKGPPARRGR